MNYESKHCLDECKRKWINFQITLSPFGVFKTANAYFPVACHEIMIIYLGTLMNNINCRECSSKK